MIKRLLCCWFGHKMSDWLPVEISERYVHKNRFCMRCGTIESHQYAVTK